MDDISGHIQSVARRRTAIVVNSLMLIINIIIATPCCPTWDVLHNIMSILLYKVYDCVYTCAILIQRGHTGTPPPHASK